MPKIKELPKTTAARRWTEIAVECYKRGCVCSGCFYNTFFQESTQKCRMKVSVLELVRTLGRPDIEVNSVIL